MHRLQAVADIAVAVGKTLHGRLQGADVHADLSSHHQLQAFLPRLQANVNEFLAATSKLNDSASALAGDFAEVLSWDGGDEILLPAAAAAVELQVACKAAADAHSAMTSQFVISPFLREIQVPSQLEQQLATDASGALDAEVHKQLKVVNAERRRAIRELFKGLLHVQLEWARASTAAVEKAESHESALHETSCRDLLIDENPGLLAASGGLTPGDDVSEPPSTTASISQQPDPWDVNDEAVEVLESSEPPSTTTSVAQGPGDLWDFDEVADEMPEVNFPAASQQTPITANDALEDDFLEDDFFFHVDDGEREKSQLVNNSEDDVAIVQMQVLDWQRGKNLRALLASLHEMLPSEFWQEKTLSELLDPLSVKEAYKIASTVVGAEQQPADQLLSKTLMTELSQVLQNAWNAFIVELVSSGLEADSEGLKEAIGTRVQQWKQGKNIRTLLASLHEVTPPRHWAVRTTSDMPDTAAVKVVYKAALLIVHPDKRVLPKALAEPVFHALQDAWEISKQGRSP
mmetsp:Transcript_97934/g.169622  ORF Transcript_97934/g.169622 Transcript_97934/m.169622 type:complete len:518 (-) Transcript_97934:78-1631(-)